MANAEEVKATRASFLPHLNGFANFGVVDGAQNLPLVISTTQVEKLHTVNFGTYETAGGSASMPFFRDGSFLGINTPPAVNVKIAQGKVLTAQMQLDQNDIAYRATDAFVRAISANNQFQLLRSEIEYVAKQTAIVEERADHHLVTAEDLALAETKLKDTEVRLQTARQQAIDCFFHVAELVGIEDPRMLRIQTNYPEPQPLPSFSGLLLRVNKNHPALVAQEGSIDEAKANLALRQIQLWPSGNINSTARYGEDLSTIGQNNWISVLSFSMPIFDFGQLHDAAKAADMNLQSQNEKLVAVHDNLRQEIYAIFVRIDEQKELLASNAISVATYQRNCDRLDELAKYGMIPVPVVLESHLLLLAQQQAREQLTLQFCLGCALLDRATAGEWKWIP
jgi:outer membrane protein TolC